MLLNLLVFIIILAVLVLVHEWGHFWAARKFGMRVDEFGIGFPPRLYAKKRGDTLWSINIIPLGGFVKIAGEDGEQESSQEMIKSFSAVAVSGDASVVEISEEVRVPSGASLRQSGGTLFSQKPIWQRMVVLCAGVFMNFLVGWLLLVGVFMVGTPQVLMVTQVSEGSPAFMAGIQEGDAISGFSSSEEFVSFIDIHKGEEVPLSLIRNGDSVEVMVAPRVDVPEGEGALGVQFVFGGIGESSLWGAIKDATMYAVQLFGMVFVLLFKLIASIFGGPSIIQYVHGPIGIFQATSQASGLGFVFLAHLIAIISLNFAALNIFPFPALDGGRVLFLLLEKIARRPISARVQGMVNAIGFALLIALILYVSIGDVARL